MLLTQNIPLSPAHDSFFQPPLKSAGAEPLSPFLPVLSPLSLNFGNHAPPPPSPSKNSRSKSHNENYLNAYRQPTPSHSRAVSPALNTLCVPSPTSIKCGNKSPTGPSKANSREGSHPYPDHQRRGVPSALRIPPPISLKSGNKTLPSPSRTVQDENHPHTHHQPSPSGFRCPPPSPCTPSIPYPISLNCGNKDLSAYLKSRSQDEDLHAYRRPSESDSRCPCPALNTLANHGYLPRDGKDIPSSKLREALMDPNTFNLSSELATLLAKGGAVLADKSHSHLLRKIFDDNDRVSLHDLGLHGGVEHDASIVHKNVAKGQKFAPVETDPDLLNAFLGEKPTISLEDIASRRVVLERVSPLTGFFAEIARGEWALVLDVFGRAHGGEIPVDLLRVWLEENRFPQGWKPEHQQGLWETIKTSADIRQAMSRIREERTGDTSEEDEETKRMLRSEPEDYQTSVRI